MSYEDILLEEADQLLAEATGYVLESGGGGGKGGSSGGHQDKWPNVDYNKYDASKPGKIGSFMANNFFLNKFGNDDVKKKIASGVLKPYGFHNIDITDMNQLERVIASIKRRRDLQAARLLLSTTIDVSIALLCKGIANNSGNAFDGGMEQVFDAASVVFAAMAGFNAVAQMVDYAKATKEIDKARVNIMEAYDTVNIRIVQSKPAGGNMAELKKYNDLLKFRDLLRGYQLDLSTAKSSFGADRYVGAKNIR